MLLPFRIEEIEKKLRKKNTGDMTEWMVEQVRR
jgi:hypothetical protein